MATKKFKNVTIDDLAGMVHHGFLDVNDKIDKLSYEMNQRFDHLEKIIFGEYKIRIEKLEDQVKELQTDFRH